MEKLERTAELGFEPRCDLTFGLFDIERHAAFLAGNMERRPYRNGHTAGWERRRREIVAEPYNFLFHVLRDENAATSDRVAAAIALMQHHRLADLDLTDGVGAAAQ